MLTEGMYIADRYEIVGKVGTGGMSDVYKAKDHILGRNVAIKVLKKEFSEDKNFVVKFRTEAQSAAGLEHPNIVNIYDVGSEEGFYYIVMEYVEGITLKTYIEKKGQLSFKEAVSIAIQVARGIEAAHNKDIIHRDIKPQNIIISTEGKVKVTDFGIAKAISSNTVSSDVMGSVHYTSPEHARNGQVDGRSDIYSLGIVMYEMVTGRVPFDGDTTVAVAIQHLQEDMVQPSAYTPNLPIAMERIIMKCTQKNPDRRYQTIAELLNDLRKSLSCPNEDFVVIATPENSSTKIITQDELKEISEGYSENAEDLEDELDDDELEDEDEDEEGALLNPKMNKAVTIMFIVVSVIIVILIIYIVGCLLGAFKPGSGKDDASSTITTESQNTESQAEEVEVPYLILVDKDDAREQLEKLGLVLVVTETKEDADAKAGSILEQNPEAGTILKKGDTVEVVVVKGDDKDYIKVPTVTGMTEEKAKSTIEDLGLVMTKSYKPSADVEKGKVISQSPHNGMVGKGTKIAVVISQGPEDVEVVSVEGKSESDAKAAIEGQGLTVNVTYENSETVEAGKVISQSVEAGAKVEPGSSVTIVVSKGKEEKNTQSSESQKPSESQEPAESYSVSGSYTLQEAGTLESVGNCVLLDANGNQICKANVTVSGNSVTITAEKTLSEKYTGAVFKLTDIKYKDNTDTEQTTDGTAVATFTKQ